jgi:hypothetical protein
MTNAQKTQLAALTLTFTSMKQLRSDGKCAKLNTLRKLKSLGLVESKDPNADKGVFICEDLEWRLVVA